MKKIFLIIGLLFSAVAAQAGPLEDLTAAFEAQKGKTSDREHAQAATQTVVRGYLSSNSGLQAQLSSNQYIGSLASKSAVQTAVASLGYTFISSQHRMDFYSGPKVADTFGFVLLVYYDLNGNTSEIYLIDDAL